MEIVSDKSGEMKMMEVIAASEKGSSENGGIRTRKKSIPHVTPIGFEDNLGDKRPAHTKGLEDNHVTSLGKYFYVEIESCTDLLKADYFGESDAFVILKINNIEIARSTIVRDCTCPEWYDECYEIPAAVYVTPDMVFSLEVWDMDAIEVGSFLGGAVFDISDFKEGEDIVTVTKGLEMLYNKDGSELERPKAKSESAFFQSLSAHDNTSFNTNDDDDDDIENGGAAALSPKPSISPTISSRWNMIKAQVKESKEVIHRYKVPNPSPTRRVNKNQIEYDDVKTSRKTTFISTGVILLYLGIGVISYSYVFESWSIIDSLYFSVVTFTTVGYGDLYPGAEYPNGCVSAGGLLGEGGNYTGGTCYESRDDRVASQVFTCLFALLGIAIIGFALQILGQQFVENQVAAMQDAQKKSKSSFGDDLKTVNEDGSPLSEEEQEKYLIDVAMQADREQIEKLEQDRKERVGKIAKICLPVTGTLLLGAIAFAYLEDWSAIQSFYWAVITAASVGYGEFSPSTEMGRLLAILFIPLSVGVIGQGLAGIVNIFIEEEIKKNNFKLMSRELTMEDLDHMNTDDDGEVSELEFIEFMLKTMKKVDQNLLDDLHRQFKKMDADGSGSLQKEDLELIAKRKIDVRRKLTLAAYKADLTNKSGHANVISIANKKKKQMAAANNGGKVAVAT
jgi:hypothetical protein